MPQISVNLRHHPKGGPRSLRNLRRLDWDAPRNDANLVSGPGWESLEPTELPQIAGSAPQIARSGPFAKGNVPPVVRNRRHIPRSGRLLQPLASAHLRKFSLTQPADERTLLNR